MSAGEETLRSGMDASMDQNRIQVAITDESRRLLSDVLEDRMRIAVAEGISAALTDEAAERFWAKGLEVLQRQATERTGRFVLGGLTAMLKKAIWVGVLVMAIYSVGGWTLLKAVWAAMNKGT